MLSLRGCLEGKQPIRRLYKRIAVSKLKNRFISAKMKILKREGKPKKQAIAIALSMWEKRKR